MVLALVDPGACHRSTIRWMSTTAHQENDEDITFDWSSIRVVLGSCYALNNGSDHSPGACPREDFLPQEDKK